MTTVAIVDGNPNLASLLGWHLRQVGYYICLAGSLEQARYVYDRYQPQVIVLSTEFGQGYLQFCRAVFQERRSFILLTGTRPHELEIVAGLQAGADDFLTKPFGIQEFLARVEALTRRLRIQPRPPSLLTIGCLQLDILHRQAKLRGHTLDLSPQEFSLLYALAQAHGQPCSRQELLKSAWAEHIDNHRTVDSHIQSLRKKMEHDPHHPDYILTVRKVGYRLHTELLQRGSYYAR
ncbi:MAG: response regulator transcription factor [Pseudanabaenaceae cyanobacterium]